jgi:hypothetical protein
VIEHMPFAELWSWLEMQPLSAYIGETAWFPFLESLHVLAATFLVGTILMADLRLLGVAARVHPVSRIVRDIVPWTWGAFALAVITGTGLFITRASAYVANTAFQMKLALLILAGANVLVLHMALFRDIERWDVHTPKRAARLAGGCSLVVWAAVLLAGRWIGHLS